MEAAVARGEGMPEFRAECVECGTEGPIAKTTLHAVKLWNRQPQKPVGFTRRARHQ